MQSAAGCLTSSMAGVHRVLALRLYALMCVCVRMICIILMILNRYMDDLLLLRTVFFSLFPSSSSSRCSSYSLHFSVLLFSSLVSVRLAVCLSVCLCVLVRVHAVLCLHHHHHLSSTDVNIRRWSITPDSVCGSKRINFLRLWIHTMHTSSPTDTNSRTNKNSSGGRQLSITTAPWQNVINVPKKERFTFVNLFVPPLQLQNKNNTRTEQIPCRSRPSSSLLRTLPFYKVYLGCIFSLMPSSRFG